MNKSDRHEPNLTWYGIPGGCIVRVYCSCGWEGNWWGSIQAASGVWGWHIAELVQTGVEVDG